MFCYKQNIFEGTKEHTYGWMDGLMVYAVVLLIYITIHDEATRLRTHYHVFFLCGICLNVSSAEIIPQTFFLIYLYSCLRIPHEYVLYRIYSKLVFFFLFSIYLSNNIAIDFFSLKSNRI